MLRDKQDKRRILEALEHEAEGNGITISHLPFLLLRGGGNSK